MIHVSDPDTEYIMLDATIVRAHGCSAGFYTFTSHKEALGRSKGGFTTKIHALVDALGNPLRFLLTPGNRHEITQAHALLKGYQSDYTIADKGYSSKKLVKTIEYNDQIAVIPSKSNSTIIRIY